jgi:alpha-beta hydrolase superfamily lysophospholipase
VKKYKNDPMCGFMFTVNAYYHMFTGMIKMNQQEKAGKISKKLPILLVSGQDDPVGNYGKSVKMVYKKYKECGVQDVKLRLYENDRHEILNEVDRDQVYADLLDWMEAHMDHS